MYTQNVPLFTGPASVLTRTEAVQHWPQVSEETEMTSLAVWNPGADAVIVYAPIAAPSSIA